MSLKKPTVAVALSGGVDSSVSALILKKMGFKIFGLFMKNWEETDASGRCLAAQDLDDVARVCSLLKIPYHTVNFAQEYQEKVFKLFLKGYASGYTPNPDVLCNKEIKFKLFLEKALALGADLIATGHYARISPSYQLLKAADLSKDQSYFLYTLNCQVLKKVLFPIGHLEKTAVRRIALENQLPTALKKDSTGLCFIGERAFRPFLAQFIQPKKGFFVTLEGKIVGEHEGAFFYTLGQREGLKIGGGGQAWFVAKKDMEKNLVFVVQGADHPALFSSSLIASDLSWVGAQPATPLTCQAKVRYRQEDQLCILEKIEGSKAYVSFTSPQRAVTPWQSIVFYQDGVCLGGGTIKSV
ncbi:MAG: tRNA 2-thiouridine(34) synthase MnmA [Parachlamydiales bacterium]|jgi:tRNA-specific 2-thiouridylase